MRKQIKDFLTFSSGEKAGIFTLAVIILGFTGIIAFIDEINLYLLPSEQEINLEKEQFEAEIALMQLRDSIKQASRIEIDSVVTNTDAVSGLPMESTPFDPNNFTTEIGRSIGLSEKQSQSILNYIEKGGQFRKKEDFRKMYVISDEKYESVADFIDLPDQAPTYKTDNFKRSKPAKREKERVRVTANINTADSSELVKVSGIGPFYAKSIVKYREELGGYVSKSQLLELYGMDKERYEALAPLLLLESTEPYRLINVNTIQVEELVKHPYFDWNLSRYLVNYRENHGNFTSVEELEKLRLIDTELYRKIAPYITL
jgi:competence ComEA-like helix-hairpin-helix protein